MESSFCRVKHLKPTKEFRQCTFVDNIRQCLLAATGTEWVVSYAPYMQSSTDMTSMISVALLEIEPCLARGWISYQELVGYFLFSPIFLPSLMCRQSWALDVWLIIEVQDDQKYHRTLVGWGTRVDSVSHPWRK